MKSATARRLAAALALALTAATPAGVAAQAARVTPASAATGLVGTWEAKVKPQQARGKAPVQLVVIRGDSSASYGKEIVRWRLSRKQGEVLLALGGEWVGYDFRVKGDQLTLSGGDLPEPVTLRRVGPATPRPAGVQVPPDPDTEEY